MKTSVIEYVAYIVVVIVSFAITTSLAYQKPNKPIGIALASTKITHKPVAVSQVNFYRQMPHNAIKVGRVRVERHIQQQSNSDAAQTLQYAKQLAAKLGANGIVTNGLQYVPPGMVPAALEKYFLQGIAVHVSNKM